MAVLKGLILQTTQQQIDSGWPSILKIAKKSKYKELKFKLSKCKIAKINVIFILNEVL